jgi:hypothetical protein
MKKVLIVALPLLLASTAWAQGNVSLPTGTALKVKLETALSTSSSKVGDPFSGRLTEAVNVDGKEILPIGSEVSGRLTKVNEPRRISGKPTLGMFPEALVLPNGTRYTLNATLVDTNQRHGTDVNDEGQFKGQGINTTDKVQMAMGTGGGMLVGGLIGGGKGVLIGGAVGASVTVAHWLGKHNSASLPAGTQLIMELSRPLEMTPVAAAGQ